MKFAILASAAGLALSVAGVASAQDAALSDSQFVRANRCLGLAASTKLDGGGDASAFASKLKIAGRGRDQLVIVRAAEARENVAREINRAREAGKAALAAERDGAECQGYQS